MNKGLIAAIVLVIIAGVGLLLWSQVDNGQQEQAPTTQQELPAVSDDEDGDVTDETEETPASHEVTYSNGSFSPGSLSIGQGDTVVFSNQAADTLWVASDPHPAHTDYPEFDSGSIGPGGTYSFTFDRSGTWGYHNHLNTRATGTIVVK